MNTHQTAAVETSAPQVLCVAGPGSGKTSTLVRAVAMRARYSGPQSVICITYTNAGANEMKARLAALPKEEGGPVNGIGFCGTLHAFLLRLLQKQFTLAGLLRPPAVVDDDVREDMLAEVAADMGVKVSKKRLQELAADPRFVAPGVRTAKADELVAVEFHRRLRAAGLLTLDGLLHYGERLVKALDGWSYRHLFVDEAQDSSDADFRIYLAMPCLTKFIVGDTDQAIYGFRGGNVANFHRLSLSGDWEVHLLERNYRCRSAIADAAQRLVDHNTCRVAKRTVAALEGGSVVVRHCRTPIEELCSVAEAVERGNKLTPLAFEEMAVLCRTNRQAKEFADFLKSKGVPVAFAERPQDPPDWKAAKLLVAALANPNSDMAWLAVVAAVDGPDAAKVVQKNAALNMTSVRTATQKLSHWRKEGLPAFSSLLSHESRARLHDACRELSEQGEWTFADLTAYLRSGETRATATPGVTVTTIHGAKGREWDCVFVVGCEEGYLPQAKKDTDVEEERRLMFVAMTRARLFLSLSWCEGRPQSRGPNLPPGPVEPRTKSRFLSEAGLDG